MDTVLTLIIKTKLIVYFSRIEKIVHYLIIKQDFMILSYYVVKRKLQHTNSNYKG